MDKKLKILCTICARGGSSGVKNKNIKKLCGKPLIAHSILKARESNLFDYICVSSDSNKILKISKEWGADFLISRPKELATETAAKLPVIQHALLQAEVNFKTNFDIIVDLDATSPLRSINDIKTALHEFLTHKHATNLVTGTKSHRSPYFNMLQINAEGFSELVKLPHTEIVRRQDAPECYDMNASIYIWKRDSLLNSVSTINKNTILYVMPPERSWDIDSPLDWKFVSLLAREKKYESK